MRKHRLDVLLAARGLAASRSKAAAMIMAAEVYVNEAVVDKPGTLVAFDAAIRLKEKPRYVGRGGLKLEAALEGFAIDPSGRICADVGASTGGFTDCLLQRGALRVYAIDVGSGLIDYRLRKDERVRLMENTNARYVESLSESPALAVVDVSFISLKLILPAVSKWLTPTADVICLVKPQFEAGRDDVGRGGIVRSLAIRRRVLREIADAAIRLGFTPVEVIRSPIRGAKGNVEFLMWLRWGPSEIGEPSVYERIELLTDRSE